MKRYIVTVPTGNWFHFTHISLLKSLFTTWKVHLKQNEAKVINNKTAEETCKIWLKELLYYSGQ